MDNNYYEQCLCELKSIIPEFEYNEILSQEYCELDSGFLGFIDIYNAISLIVPKEMCIIDFGCYLSAQSYFFKDHSLYIGIDTIKLKRFKPKNAIHYIIDIETYINEELPKLLDKVMLDSIFAICSYVPDFNANKLIRETFTNVFSYYPPCYSRVSILI